MLSAGTMLLSLWLLSALRARCSGARFKKYRHGFSTTRVIWCDQNLNHVMWGDPEEADVRGMLPFSKVFSVERGAQPLSWAAKSILGSDGRRIFLRGVSRTLELEASYDAMALDWTDALQFAVKRSKQARAQVLNIRSVLRS